MTAATATPLQDAGPRATPPRATPPRLRAVGHPGSREDARPGPARPAPQGRSPQGRAQAWRRRLVAALVLTAVVVALGAALGRLLAPSPAGDVRPATPVTVVVSPGGSLWSVAVEHAPPGVSPAQFVDELQRVNDLPGTSVSAWEVLRLP